MEWTKFVIVALGFLAGAGWMSLDVREERRLRVDMFRALATVFIYGGIGLILYALTNPDDLASVARWSVAGGSIAGVALGRFMLWVWPRR